MKDDFIIRRPMRAVLRRALREMWDTATRQTLVPSVIVAFLVAAVGWGIEGELDANAPIAAAIAVVVWLLLVYGWHVIRAPIQLNNEQAGAWCKERDLLNDELAEAKQLLAQRDASARPNLSFIEPRVEHDVPMHTGGTQTWVFGGVVNDQSSPGRGLEAQRAHLTMTYRSGYDDTVLAGPFPGKWRDAHSSLELSRLRLHSDGHALDLHANGNVYEFDLATRREDSGQLFGVDAGQNPHAFVQRRVVVTVDLKGVNFETLTATFVLENTPLGITVERQAP
jgi:hypothetical protein